jgi:hypothetical protein
MTQEELAQKYEELGEESIALVRDLRAGTLSVKQSELRFETLALSFELLQLAGEIERRLQSIQDATIQNEKRTRGKRI